MRLERLLAIVMYLLSVEKVSGKELAERFEVSIRTIYRDIETINQAGIPIITQSGLTGGIGIMKEFMRTKQLLTITDIATILMGINATVAKISTDEINNTLVKVNSLIPQKKQQEITFKANQLVIEPSNWIQSDSVIVKLAQMKQAIDKRQHLSFDYLSHSSEETKRTVEPYQLINKENYWYLKGYCLLREDFRLFKLSRMSEIEQLTTNYECRTIPAVIDPFIAKMGEKRQKITIQFTKEIMDRIVDYCERETMKELETGEYAADLSFIDDDEGYRIWRSMLCC